MVENYKGAVECYDKIIEINPNNALAWVHKGIALFKMAIFKMAMTGKVINELFEEAIECYNRALEINHIYAEAWINKGNTYGNMNKYGKAIYEKALQYYNRALEIDPIYEKALQYYNRALEIDPIYAEAWINKGNTYYNMNKYDEAIECYNRALEINPKDAEAWFNKGFTYGDMNKYNEAIECFIKSLSLCILQNKDIDLIESLIHDIMEEFITDNSINEEIRKDAKIIICISLYLIRKIIREECINKIKDLKGSARREALIHAVINNEDRNIAINDIVDEAFDDLKRCVLDMQNNKSNSNSNNK
jgi:tetratricopeptide (TPR) repeat protein